MCWRTFQSVSTLAAKRTIRIRNAILRALTSRPPGRGAADPEIRELEDAPQHERERPPGAQQRQELELAQVGERSEHPERHEAHTERDALGAEGGARHSPAPPDSSRGASRRD